MAGILVNIGKKRQIVLLMVIIYFAIIIIPQDGQAAACDSYLNNYTMCLEQRSVTECACCVLSTPGTYSLANNCSAATNCNKLIGVFIEKNNIVLNGDTSHPVTPDRYSGNCTVGILVGHEITNQLNNVKINNVTVRDWQNGIMYWKSHNGFILNSSILNNTNGIYLMSSTYNNISTNNISSNDVGILLESHNPPFNTRYINITNNILSNANNTDFINLLSNYWDVSPVVYGQQNVIGGPNIGGNYWSDLSPGCDCLDNGFCIQDRTIGPNNIDHNPLCVRIFSFSVDGPDDIWHFKMGDNFWYKAISYQVESSRTWHIDITASNGGIMKTSDGFSLTNVMHIRKNQTVTWCSLSGQCTIPGSNSISDWVDLSQVIELKNRASSDYQLTLYFTAAESIPL